MVASRDRQLGGPLWGMLRAWEPLCGSGCTTAGLRESLQSCTPGGGSCHGDHTVKEGEGEPREEESSAPAPSAPLVAAGELGCPARPQGRSASGPLPGLSCSQGTSSPGSCCQSVPSWVSTQVPSLVNFPAVAA